MNFCVKAYILSCYYIEMVSVERKVGRKFKEIDGKMKNSFGFIRQDIDEMKVKIEKMRTYLKKREKQDSYARKEDNKLRAEFRKDVDGFNEKMGQLGLALGKVREIERGVVVRKDLAGIEEGIRGGFKDEINLLREEIEEMKKSMGEFKKIVEDFSDRLRFVKERL